MSYIALDDDGSPMTLYMINTIAPVAHADAARELALFHLQQIEGTRDSDVNQMLPTLLYDVNTNAITHIMCARHGYNNTIRNQQATMLADNLNGNTWVSDTYFYLEDNPDIATVKSKMCFVLGDTAAVLQYLGLRE